MAMHTSSLSICFVCWGNTCRSPFAEFYARKHYGNRGHFSSCGLYAKLGGTASHYALLAAQWGWEIDLSLHVTQPVSAVQQDITIWVVMTHDIGHTLHTMYGIPLEKIRCISTLGIADPFGNGVLVYQQIYESIASNVADLMGNL